ncbi:FAD-binding oxidoreductase [Leptobacterium sp. I13]|uniref:FAD-binding oxidoreductase n=1 Tax=Leptobacterium meishanense TaxID=3128904 RepID=UPI0030ECE764
MSELGEEVLLMGQHLEGRHDHIWNMGTPIKAKMVVLPRSTEEVSALCKICNEHGQRVTIHGGLTGLVGGTRSNEEDLVISLERMNKIEEVDELSRTMTVQAGAILEEIHEEVSKKQLFFPLNFGAKGSAQIGGCIATNAGGLRVLRYGMTRNMILGLETVLADGTIIRSLKKIIKNNTGYDLNQLFIGSEGTLGIVTRAVLKLEEEPVSRNNAFIAFKKYTDVVAFLKYADKKFSGQLSGFEIMWGDTYQALTSPPSSFRPPIQQGSEFYVLIETLGSNQEEGRKEMESVLEGAMQKGMLEDAVIAYSAADMDWFWNIREDVGMINTLSPYQQHFDISIPVDRIAIYVEKVKEKLKEISKIKHVHAFGHLADGNIHFIVGKENNEEGLKQKINEIVYSPLKELNGSISAEHGIGIDKKKWLSVSRTKEEIELMKRIKEAFDPKGILNPGRILNKIN